MLWLLQSSLFLLLAGAMLVVVRRWGPSVEAMACRLVLVGTCLLPALFCALAAIGVSGPLWSASTRNVTAVSSLAALPTITSSHNPIPDSPSDNPSVLPTATEESLNPKTAALAPRLTSIQLLRVVLVLGWLCVSSIMFVAIELVDLGGGPLDIVSCCRSWFDQGMPTPIQEVRVPLPRGEADCPG